MTVAAILVAAGAGKRLGAGRPKAFVELWNEALYVHAARSLLESGAVDSLVVVVPDGYRDEATAALRHRTAIGGVALRVVSGGPSRQASVALGLAALPADADVVLVHDAARALAPPALVSDVARSVRAGHGAVVPGLAVADTVKRVGPADDTGARPVAATLQRDELRLIQTPQGFARDLLERAHRRGADRAADESRSAGDDAALVEELGEQVHVIPGDPTAFKITGPHELLIAAAFLQADS
jgi:2-C-methyl-D-erythritol 4-phosphate cytidylyltransferase